MLNSPQVIFFHTHVQVPHAIVKQLRNLNPSSLKRGQHKIWCPSPNCPPVRLNILLYRGRQNGLITLVTLHLHPRGVTATEQFFFHLPSPALGSQPAHCTLPPTGHAPEPRLLEGCLKTLGAKQRRSFKGWRAARARLKELTRALKPTLYELSHVLWKHRRVCRIPNSVPPRRERMSALKSNVLVPLSSLSFTQWAVSLLCYNTLDSSFLSAPTLNCHTSLQQREAYWWTSEHSRRDASMESNPWLALTWFERRVSGRQTHNIVYRIALFFPFVAHGILRVIHSSLFNPLSLWLHFTKQLRGLTYILFCKLYVHWEWRPMTRSH